jgi:hypothetical protein
MLFHAILILAIKNNRSPSKTIIQTLVFLPSHSTLLKIVSLLIDRPPLLTTKRRPRLWQTSKKKVRSVMQQLHRSKERRKIYFGSFQTRQELEEQIVSSR